MGQIKCKTLSIILALSMVFSIFTFSPVKEVQAEGIGDYGVCDASKVSGSYNQVTASGNYFEYTLSIENKSGETVKDWIAVITTGSNIEKALNNNPTWNHLASFKDGNTLYVYTLDSPTIYNGSSFSTPDGSKFSYTGSSVTSISVYYSTTENAFDEFKGSGSGTSGGGEIVDGITDYGYDTKANYARLLQESLYFYDINMCGKDVGEKTGVSWRDDCHVNDSATYNGKTIDLSGGYHDAGDHPKFGLPQAYAASLLGMIYVDYKDDFDELGQSDHMKLHLNRFAEYFKKCTVMDNNGKVEAFCYQVGDGNVDHSYWGKPENQSDRNSYIYFTSASTPCTDIVAETAAALAIHAYIFDDDESLKYAKALLEYAETNNKSGSGNSPYAFNFYNGTNWEDDLALACYWINKASSDNTYLNKFNSYMTNASVGWTLCWNEVWAAAMLSSNDSRLSTLISNRMNAKTPAGFAYVADWGTARYNAALQYLALTSDMKNGTNTYKSWARGQMNYILGNNPASKCYVVGYNERTILYPHHRAASGYNNVSSNKTTPLAHTLVGTLVGGPTSSDAIDDNAENYETNEVALDYQAGLVGAAVALYHAYKEDETVDQTLATNDQLSAMEVTKFYAASVDPAHVHSPGNPVYTWGKNHEYAEATVKCTVCKEVLKYEKTVDVSVSETAASCTEKGSETYTAHFTDTEFTDQEDIVEINALGHRWGEPVYEWADDYSKCTATIICSNNTGISCKVEEVYTLQKSDSQIITEPTCKSKGTKKYTAVFQDSKFSTQTKTVELPLGAHVLTEKPAVANTCEADGNIKYYICSTCGKYFSDENGKTEISASDTVVPKKGHLWGDWKVTKEASETEDGEQKRVCINDPSHVETAIIPKKDHEHSFTYHEGNAATCTEDGNIAYYTCSGCNHYFVKDKDDKYTVVTSIVDPAKGHEYELDKYIWAEDNSYVIGKAKCKNDPSHELTIKVDTTYEVIEEPGEETTGKGLYTSKDFNEACFTVQTKEVEIPAKDKQDEQGDPVPDDTDKTVTPSGSDNTPTAGGNVITPTVVDNGKSDNANAAKPETPAVKTEEKQLAADGTAVGAGASEAAAEEAIITSESEESPAGSVYNLLQARMKKTTKDSITISWKKISGATYTVYGNACGKGNKYEKITTLSKNSFIHKKLKKGKYYKYIVVAVKDGKVVSTSKTLHISTKGGKVDNTKKISLNKKNVSLKKGKTFNLKARLTSESKKLIVNNHRSVKYESADEQIATVSPKGKIKAVGKGTTYVYAYAQNGMMAKIKVTVK